MYFIVVFFFHRACLVESIYQRPRMNTIAPSNIFQRIQISAYNTNAVTTQDYSLRDKLTSKPGFEPELQLELF